MPNDVLDVGCGDLSFWDWKDCEKYVGIDSSESIIKKNQAKRPRWTFIHMNASSPIKNKSETVFCFDMLFHVMNDMDYTRIIDNLTACADKYIVIGTWKNNPLSSETDGEYQYYRDFERDWIPKIEESGFELIKTEVFEDNINAIWIFSRVI